MSLILGTIIQQPIQIPTSYLHEILKEIKHYLTLQTSITLKDNEYCLTIASSRKLFSTESNNKNEFSIPKNFAYLFTHWQKIFVQNEEDLEFFDVCYQCLMIVKEYLPNKIQINVQIMKEMTGQENIANGELSLVDFVQNFQNEKSEEFTRRINSNFKSLVSHHQADFTKFQVQNLLYLSENYYLYKNKLAALKFLAYNQHISKEVFASIDDKYLRFFKELSLDEDFRAYCEQVVEKVEVAKQIINNKKYDESSHYFESQQNSQYKNNESQFMKDSRAKSQQKSQKQFRLPNKSNHAAKHHQKIRSPLKMSSKQNQNLNRLPDNLQKQDKLKNLSVKSLLFQLRESQSLKRLSMLIQAASEIKIQDQKYEMKIEKEIQNICRNFMKESYLERFSTNQSILQHSQNRSNNDRGKNHHLNESYIPTTQQVQEVTRFYESLKSYFSKKDSFIKIQDNHNKRTQKIGTRDEKNREGKSKYNELLYQVCQKIQQQYYYR